MSDFDANQLDLTDDQFPMFEDLTRELAERVELEAMQIRGFLWRSIKLWQAETHQSVGSIATMPPADRLRSAQAVMAHFEQRVLTLFDSENRREGFRQALAAIMARYENEYSHRAPQGSRS